MAKENWTKSSWTISIGTAIFSLLLTMIYDYFKEEPILTTIWTIIKWIGNLLWTILNFDIKVWWIIIALTLLVFLLYIFDKLKNDESFKPDFYNYKEDFFKHWKWSWNWELNRAKTAWVVSNMQAHCPNCDTPMIDRSNSYENHFECPRCDFKASDRQCDEPYKIERLILDNIDRKKQNVKTYGKSSSSR